MMKRPGVAADAMERLWTVWSGFHDGASYAHHHAVGSPYLDADRIVATAEAECRRRASEALDQADGHPAYTYGWMAGYLAAQRERASDAAESAGAPDGTDAEQPGVIIAFPRSTAPAADRP